MESKKYTVEVDKILDPYEFERNIWSKYEHMVNEIVQHLTVRFNHGEHTKIKICRCDNGVERPLSKDVAILNRAVNKFERDLQRAGWSVTICQLKKSWWGLGIPYVELQVRNLGPRPGMK
jgi:hypothetical protein